MQVKRLDRQTYDGGLDRIEQRFIGQVVQVVLQILRMHLHIASF